MNFRLCSLTTFVLSLTVHFALAGPVEQGSKAPSSEPVQADHPMYLGTFNTGVKTSDVYTEGNLSLVVPVWSSLGTDGILGGGVVYLEPYVSLGEQDELATSLGLGWRYLFNDQRLSALQSDTPAAFLTEGFYVGANLFVDNLRTQFDNDFWQLGLGAEIGTRYLEVRGNYYLPFDGSPQLAERSTDTQNFTSRSSRSSTRTETNSITGGDPYATQHSIVQDANLTTTAITTTSTTTTKTTVKTITSLFEEGMEGWDLEAAVLIPGLDRYLDVTLLAGYYSFDNQPFGPQRGPSGNTEGWKAGIEIRPVPALVLTGMWYEDEGLTGSDWVAGIGLQIPLGKDWQDAFKSRRRHLIERLAEPVARQNAAIKTARSVDVDQDITQQTSTRTAVRRQIVSQSRQRIVIREDIIFVNNGDAVGNGIQAGSATGDGTAEQPYDTIQAGADHAGSNNVATQRAWNVYTQHTPTTYSESVTLSASTHLISSFTSILSPLNGAAFGGNTPRPVVAGGFAADSAQFLPGVTLPSAVSITAYDISGGYSAAVSLSVNIPGGINAGSGDGIYFEDIDQVIVADSLVTDVTAGNGIFLSHLGSQQATIRGNTVTASGEKGIFLKAGAFTGDISANTANENGGDGIRTDLSGGNMTGDIIGNTANENSAGGIYTGVFGGGSITGNIAGNTVNENSGNGIYTIVFGGGDLTGNITGNTAIQNQSDGIYTTVSGGGDLSGSITGNTANKNMFNGITVDVFNGGDISGSITGNTANENGNTGIKTQAFGGDLSGSITGNTANENRSHGFFTNVSGGGNIIGNITGNTANKNEIIGIRTDVAGGGGISGDITGNTANENEDHGIKTEVIGGGSITGNINDNTTNKNEGYGIYTAVFTGGSMTGDVNGNTAYENEGYGIYTMVFGGGDMAGDINGNTANLNQFDGIYTSVGGGGDLTGSITGNTANQNGAEGISMEVYNSGDITGSITGNSAGQNESDGIIVRVYNGGNLIGNITDNTANENGVSGIGGGMVLYIDGIFDGSATGNTANDNPGFGFDTRATALGGSAITSPNNASGNGISDFNTSFGVPIINP